MLALECESQLTRQQLLKKTGLPERTLDDALKTLETRGYIVTSRKTSDLRQKVAEIAIKRPSNR